MTDLSVTAHLTLPAEWEPHEATWIAWPHNTSDWPGKFHPIPWVYAEIARKIAEGELLRVLVNSSDHRDRAISVLKRAGADLSRIEFFSVPTNRGWTRDFGPIFVRRIAAAEPPCNVIIRCQFNAWAKYPDWQLDNAVSAKVAAEFGYPIVEAEVKGQGIVLEGGAIGVNGAGDLLTTEECLLDASMQARNPNLNRGEIEGALRSFFGATNVLWLGRGIAGDDTHGHIDDLCRFTGARTVVLCQEADANDENYRPLQENRERLEGMRLADGSRPEVVPLP
ncbi:MAG: agmatine deiminase family protein, partial [Acidobacteriota bacterium]|nr:agmatine deiminase family protein [Acidobacteriota bacterium]